MSKTKKLDPWVKEPTMTHCETIVIDETKPPLTLTFTGSETEIRQYLDGPCLACIISDLDEDLRAKLKHGNQFKTADEAMEWVRGELGVGE